MSLHFNFRMTGNIVALLLSITGNAAALVAVFLSGEGNFGASLVLAAAFVIGAAHFSYLVWSPYLRPVCFSMLLYFNYGFILPGLFVTRTSEFYWHSIALTDANIGKASLVVLISMLAFSMGYFSRLAGSRKKRQRSVILETELEEARAVRLRKSQGALLVALIAAGYILVIATQYGFGLFIGTRAAIGAYANELGLGSASFGLYKSLCQSLAVGACCVTFYLRFVAGYTDKFLASAIIIAIFALLIGNNPLFVPRFWIVANIFILLLTLFRGLFTTYKSFFYLLSPLMMYFIVPTLGAFNRRGDELDLSLKLVNPSELMAHGDLDGFQSITNVLELVKIDGLGLGKHFLSWFFFYVPRSFWHGKQEATGSMAAEASGYTFTRISMPLPGELYSDGGFLAVTLGMFFWGYLVQRLDRTFRGFGLWHARMRPIHSMLAILLTAFMPILMRGSLLSVVPGVMISTGIVMLWYYLSTSRLRSASRQGTRNSQ